METETGSNFLREDGDRDYHLPPEHQARHTMKTAALGRKVKVQSPVGPGRARKLRHLDCVWILQSGTSTLLVLHRVSLSAFLVSMPPVGLLGLILHWHL